MICPLKVLTLGSINHFYTHSKYLFGSRILIIRKNSRVKGRFNIIFWRFEYWKWQIFTCLGSINYFYAFSKYLFGSRILIIRKKLGVKRKYNIIFWRFDYRKWQILAYPTFLPISIKVMVYKRPGRFAVHFYSM